MLCISHHRGWFCIQSSGCSGHSRTYKFLSHPQHNTGIGYGFLRDGNTSPPKRRRRSPSTVAKPACLGNQTQVFHLYLCHPVFTVFRGGLSNSIWAVFGGFKPKRAARSGLTSAIRLPYACHTDSIHHFCAKTDRAAVVNPWCKDPADDRGP